MNDLISRSAEQYPIDGEELFNRVQKLKHYEIRQNLFDDAPMYEVFKCQDVLDAILASERLDVAPVVHAKWKMTDSPYCSHCNRIAMLRYKYCPNCGAKMDGDRNG